MGVILLIETSTEVCSVAIASSNEIIDIEENPDGLNHSELLTSFIENILKRNNLQPSALDAVAVSKGPGSYTGLRIGVSVAKGLCYALRKPLIAVSTLDALTWHVVQNPQAYNLTLGKNSLLCPMIDARRMEVYFAVYNNLGDVVEPISAKIITSDSFADLFEKNKIIFFGNGAHKCIETIIHPSALFMGPEKVSARFMAGLSWLKFQKNEFEDVAYFEPFYLKDFVATVPRNKVF